MLVLTGCYDTIVGHVNVRSYKDEDVSREDVKKILEAERRSPTAWNLQPYLVSVVRDESVKLRIVELVRG